MKRFIIELANWKKQDMKKTREICIFPENLQDEKIVNKKVDNYVKACKIGLITEIEAAEAICKISPWLEGGKA